MFSKTKQEPPKATPADPKSLGFDELIAIKQTIDREIASRRDTEIEALKSRATAAASALGIPVAELFGIHVPVVQLPEPRKTRRAPKVRYRDPENPDNTWTGKGRVPKWMQDKLDQGAEKEAFQVQ